MRKPVHRISWRGAPREMDTVRIYRNGVLVETQSRPKPRRSRARIARTG